MNADLMKTESEILLHAELTQKIIGVFFDVYNELGPGLLEAVYRNAMCIALGKAGLTAEAEVPVNVMFQGEIVGEYRADILVNDVVILELKTAHAIDRIHQAQLMNYRGPPRSRSDFCLTSATDPNSSVLPAATYGSQCFRFLRSFQEIDLICSYPRKSAVSNL